jgi:hypothetical protein
MTRNIPAEAPAEVAFDPSAALVTLRYDGLVDATALSATHETMMAAIAGRTAIGALIDVRRSQATYTAQDLIDSLDQSFGEVAFQRCAVVSEVDREQLIRLMESVAVPHGVRVRAFTVLEDARRWASGG